MRSSLRVATEVLPSCKVWASSAILCLLPTGSRDVAPFAEFELTVQTAELRKADGTIIRLSEQPLCILVALLERPGELVLREDQHPEKWDEQAFGVRETVPMKKPSQQLIAEVPRRQRKVEMTIGIDLRDVWSRYCTLHQGGDIVGRGRFWTNV